MASEAAVWKQQGNEAFAAKDYDNAIRHFTKAIELDPNNHVLWSNRSACYASLNNFQAAKDDAHKCVSLKPDWSKGYVRLGAAEHGLKQYGEAIKTFKKGLEIEPQNESLLSGLRAVEDDAKAAGQRTEAPRDPSNPFAKIFGPDCLAKIAANPRLMPFLAQPDYVQMIKMVSQNPDLISGFLKDQRMMQTFMELSGIDFSRAGAGGKGGAEDHAEPSPSASPNPKASAAPSKEEPKKKAEPPKSQALAVKEEGNAHYKKREFDEALKCYHKALELEPTNTTFLLNITAVLFEQSKFDECLAEVEKALEHGKENKADYTVIAKLLTRKASCLQKKNLHSEAIALFKQALLEWRNPETLSKLEACEKEKKQLDEAAYRDPEIAKAKKEEGNTHFKEQHYPEAVTAYSESIKRNPDEHTTYTNRAACYIKLGAFDEAIKDCDTCIKLKPDFVRAYVRKGNAYHFRKQYNLALQAYDAGLKVDANNEELKDGKEKTLQKIQELAMGTGEEADQEDVARRAMDDPEIRQIMGDSYMQLVLSEMQKDPKRLQEYMRDPNISAKLNKLITAGILRFGGKAPEPKKAAGGRR